MAGSILLVLMAVVFWFLLIRPQRRRQQQLNATRSSMAVGSEVMLGSGIYGRVSSLEDETVHLELAPGVSVKVARQAVTRVLDEGYGIDAADEVDEVHGIDEERATTGNDPMADGPADPFDPVDHRDRVEPGPDGPTEPRR